MLPIEHKLVQESVKASFSVLSKVIPSQNRPPLENYDLNLVRDKYKNIETSFYLATFVVIPVIIFLFTLTCSKLQELFLRIIFGNVVYLVPVSQWAFTVPLIFLSILIFGLLSDVMLHYLCLKVGGSEEEWQVFYYDMNRRHAMGSEVDNRLLSKYFTIITLVFTLPALVLAFDNYSYVTPKAIVHNPYFSFSSQDFAFTDIKKILHISSYKNNVSKEVVPTTPSYSIVTSDNRQWGTLNTTLSNTPKEVSVINYISEQSTVPVTIGVHNIDDK